MSIQIDRTKCVGCGQCAEICPGTLIRMTQKKAEMRYPDGMLGLRVLCQGMSGTCDFPVFRSRHWRRRMPHDSKQRRQFAALDCQPTGCVGGDHYRR